MGVKTPESFGVPSNLSGEGDENVIKTLISTEKAINRVCQALRGWKQDPNTGDFIKMKGSKPLMNDMGIAAIEASLRPFSEQFVLSVLTEQEIKNTLSEFLIIHSMTLATKMNAWDVEVDHLFLITNAVFNLARAIAWRGLKGATLGGITDAINYGEDIKGRLPPMGEQRPRGLFGRAKSALFD